MRLSEIQVVCNQALDPLQILPVTLEQTSAGGLSPMWLELLKLRSDLGRGMLDPL